MNPFAEPKVFISYAWGTEDYQQKVLDFANRLYKECGVEVVIDKWEMEAGNDTSAFMERCVNDPSINFVLMLLDKNYAEKANARKGGAGTETQIISPKVYKDAEQTKFVPVVFERDDEGNVYKPAYLESRYHFDLTKDNANDEFMRLVRHLYGEQTYPKPENKGKKPDWVSQPQIVPEEVAGLLFEIAGAANDSTLKVKTKRVLKTLREGVFAVEATPEELSSFSAEPAKYLNFLERYRPSRDAVIKVFDSYKAEPDFTDMAADFFEDYKAALNDRTNSNNFISQAAKALLHEIFIYTIAMLWEADYFSKIHDLVTRTYFLGGKFHNNKTANFSDVVFSGGHNNPIENAKKKLGNKNYYNGQAQVWSEHVMAGFTLEQIVLADDLIMNLSILEQPEGTWYWFPILYIYDTEGNSVFARFAYKLRSERKLTYYKELFGSTKSGETLDDKLAKMKRTADKNRYSYSLAFENAPLIIDYVKPEEIGTLA